MQAYARSKGDLAQRIVGILTTLAHAMSRMLNGR
jgi:hypothetical protein